MFTLSTGGREGEKVGRKQENTSKSKQGLISTLHITEAVKFKTEEGSAGAEQAKAFPITEKEYVRGGI
jgi:hypothetical protein